MSPLVWLIGALVLVVLLVFVLRLIGGVVGFVISGIVVLIMVAGGVYVVKDVNDLRQHFYKDNKLFVLEIDNVPVGAFVLGGDSGKPELVDDLSRIRNSWPDLESIRGKAYKVVVIDWEVVRGDIETGFFVASEEEVRAALLSADARRLFIEKTAQRLGLTEQSPAFSQVVNEADKLYPTSDLFRSVLFALLAGESLQKPEIIFAGFKKGIVKVHPETITFKILKLVPEGMMGLFVQQDDEQAVGER